MTKKVYFTLGILGIGFPVVLELWLLSLPAAGWGRLGPAVWLVFYGFPAGGVGIAFLLLALTHRDTTSGNGLESVSSKKAILLLGLGVIIAFLEYSYFFRVWVLSPFLVYPVAVVLIG